MSHLSAYQFWDPPGPALQPGDLLDDVPLLSIDEAVLPLTAPDELGRPTVYLPTSLGLGLVIMTFSRVTWWVAPVLSAATNFERQSVFDAILERVRRQEVQGWLALPGPEPSGDPLLAVLCRPTVLTEALLASDELPRIASMTTDAGTELHGALHRLI